MKYEAENTKSGFIENIHHNHVLHVCTSFRMYNSEDLQMSLKVAFLDNDQFTWISKEIEFIIIVYLFAVYKGRRGIPLYSK